MSNSRKIVSQSTLGIALLAAASLAASASLAPAAPVIIEIQLPADTLTMLLWDRLYVEEVCALDAFPFPTPTGDLAVLDRITFPDRPEVINTGDGAAILIPADVFLRFERCLTRQCGATNYFTWSINRVARETDPLPLELEYSLDLTVDTETDPREPTATLCLSLESVLDTEGGQLIPASFLPSELRDALEGFECPSFSLGSLQRNLLGDGSSITRSGISASGNGARLAMRFEVDGPSSDSESSWEQFSSGVLAPTDGSMAWSLFLDPRLLVNRVRNQIDHEMTCQENRRLEQCGYDFDDDGLACHEDPDDGACDESSPFHRTSGPTADWSAGGASGGGHIHVELSGEIPGGFSETPCPNVLHIDPIEIDVDLRVESTDPGWMKSRILIDPDPDDGDVALCALLMASPALDIATITTLVVIAVVADSYDPSASQVGLDNDCTDRTAPSCRRYCDQLDDDEYDCADRLDFNDPLDVGGPTIGVMRLTNMVGRSDGAILGGSLQRAVRPPLFGPAPLPPFPQVDRQPLSVGNGIIVEGVQGGCSSLRWGYSGSFSVSGDGELCEPISVHNDPPERHDNTLGVYNILWPGADPRGPNHLGNQAVEIRFPATSNQTVINGFWADPYDLEVLVRSSAGLQYRVIPAPAPPNNARRIEELSQAMSDCDALSFGFRLPLRALNFLWLPDPPPFEIILQASYETHLPPGEIHHAFLTELTARTLTTVAAAPLDHDVFGLMFPGVQIAFEGKIHFDFGSLGQKVVPFSTIHQRDLWMTDIETGSFDSMLTMSNEVSFGVKIEPQDLPQGIRAADAFFQIPADAVTFQTALLQIAGPADFDQSGDVFLYDWFVMAARCTGPGVVGGGRLLPTDFDRDGDTDLHDIGAFQNWVTGER